MENLNDDEAVNRTWENINENIKTSAEESLGLHEFKQNKPWFDEECPVQTGPGVQSASRTMGTGSFLGAKNGRGVTLTPHPF